MFTGGGPFVVNSLTGQILTNGQLNHESTASYLLTIRAELIQDGSLFTLAQVTNTPRYYHTLPRVTKCMLLLLKRSSVSIVHHRKHASNALLSLTRAACRTATVCSLQTQAGAVAG